MGESSDVVPVIANLLGFDSSIPGYIGVKDYNSCDLKAAFY
jgi:hypothetical protein